MLTILVKEAFILLATLKHLGKLIINHSMDTILSTDQLILQQLPHVLDSDSNFITWTQFADLDIGIGKRSAG